MYYKFCVKCILRWYALLFSSVPIRRFGGSCFFFLRFFFFSVLLSHGPLYDFVLIELIRTCIGPKNNIEDIIFCLFREAFDTDDKMAKISGYKSFIILGCFVSCFQGDDIPTYACDMSKFSLMIGWVSADAYNAFVRRFLERLSA